MKIACYSDLHLEFKHHWTLPANLTADLLVLAGDILVFDDFSPLKTLLSCWRKPVIYVAGNHEYYTNAPMHEARDDFKVWLASALPQVHFLDNESVTVDGVNFFGGTMWTDFNNADLSAMTMARKGMIDYKLIRTSPGNHLTPTEALGFHRQFIKSLTAWFAEPKPGPRVVITHHAPVENIQSEHLGSPLQPAFIAYDLPPLIEKYQPAAWIYGHTHECHIQTIGMTKIISNQLGYHLKFGGYECGHSFDIYGLGVNV